jgi:hypothetical protein
MFKKWMDLSIDEENKKKTKKGFAQIPLNYDEFNKFSSTNFQSIHLGKAPYFDGTNYPKWAYDIKMHLFGLHPLLWEIVNVGVN